MKNINIALVNAVLLMTGCAHYISNSPQIVLPTVKEMPALIYPKEAKQNNFTGNTTVEIFISKTGSVLDTKILQSSGYNILDDAAKEYCDKITFNPATANGIPINSRSIFKVKFDLSDQQAYGKKYVSDINKLYSNLTDESVIEKYSVERDILNKHKEFIGNMQDAADYISTIKKILLPEITEQWEAYMDYCPLTFLVYHDFMTRFPDYEDISNVKIDLNNAVNNDLRILEKIPAQDFENPSEKEALSSFIRNFIRMKYPDLNFNHVMHQAINS
jgi:TonB family protein